MTDVVIRSFQHEDLPAVLALYARVMTPRAPRYCPTLRAEQVTRQFFGHPEFREDGLFVAESAGAVVGFAFGAVRLTPITPDDDLAGVYLSLLLVDEAFRRRGLGSTLLARVAEFGRRYGKTTLCASANPMNPLACWPGVDRTWTDAVGLLRAHGGTLVHTEVSMDQPVDEFVLSDYAAGRLHALAADGFRIVSYTPAYHDALLAAAGTPFWVLDLQSKIDPLPHPFIETAFLDLDMAHIYGPDDITLALHGDALAGFVALCRNPGETISFLGPIRIADRYQGAGLGSVMIQSALLRERAHGITLVDLWCSQANADRFYARNGFVQREAWDQYEIAM